MPIYAYKCATCGFAKDVLQKISDPPLTVCPSCGAPAFQKQVTAAGFQLKGSGWYVTDFRDGKGGQGKTADKGAGGGDAAKDGDAGGTRSDSPAAPAPAPAPAASPATAPSPAPAAKPSAD